MHFMISMNSKSILQSVTYLKDTNSKGDSKRSDHLLEYHELALSQQP